MLHPFFRSSRPLVFAHRGGSGLAPENTITAFDQAMALGVDGLELDVRLTADGIVVVHHDRSLERTTNLTGPVVAYTAEQLARADAGRSFRDASGARPFEGRGIGVPTLAGVLARYRQMRVIIELKDDRPELARAVVDVVHQAEATPRVCLGSFARGVVRAARACDPALATSAAREEVRWALYRSWCRWPVSRVPYHGYQVPECTGRTRVVSQAFVRAAHRAGLGVQVWTVDTEADAQRLLGWGVDGLITDRPDLIVPVVAALGGDSASDRAQGSGRSEVR